MILAQETRDAFKNDVLDRYPEEACGLVIGGNYHPCKNVHEEPTRQFRIDGKERGRLELANGPAQAVLHSHPYKLSESTQFYKDKYNPAWPSELDQASFIADSIPWGIVATDGGGISDVEWLNESEMKPLERREFAWFTADCFTCVRDWHRVNTGIVMPNFTRKWQFWEDGINTIEDNLATLANSTRYPTSQAQVGDIAVIALGGFEVVNHLGVISGNNEFFHQFVHRYAHTTRWDLWARQARYVFRMSNE